MQHALFICFLGTISCNLVTQRKAQQPQPIAEECTSQSCTTLSSDQTASAKSLSPKSEQTGSSIRAQKEQLLTELYELGAKLDQALTAFQQNYAICEIKGIRSQPLLSLDLVAKYKDQGVQALGLAFINLPGPEPEQQTTKEETESGQQPKQETSAEETKEATHWYKDQTNWGVINMLIGVGLVLSGASYEKPILKMDQELQKIYTTFKSGNPSASLQEFTTHINTNKGDLAESLADSISKQNTKIRKARIKAAVEIALGMGVFIGGALMFYSSLSLTATKDRCEANNQLRESLFEIRTNAGLIKEQIYLLDQQASL